MDAFMEFEREMAIKRMQSQPQATRLKRAAPLSPPQKPKEDECCKLDCPNCVLLVYQEKLLEYELSLLQESQSAAITDGLAPKKPDEPKPKCNITYLDEPTAEQRALLSANDLSVFGITANALISVPHRTKDDWWRSVRHIDLHVSAFQKSYVGEDASNIAVFVPNDASVVDRMLAHLQVDPDLTFTAEPIKEASSDPNAKHVVQRPFDKIGSVREVLTWSFDLVATPRAGFLRALAAYASDDDDVRALSMPNAIEAIKAERDGREVTVADLCDRFKSLRLTFAKFFQFAPLNAPRYYTVSSSRRFSPETVSLTLGLKKRESQPVPRCSSYLAALEPGKDAIRASFFHSSFVFPAQDRRPILLVSAGTGIAPFRAFLQDLEHERADEQFTLATAVSSSGGHSAAVEVDTEDGGGAHRNAYLFYGCRSPEVDFLYSDEMQRAYESQVLDQLHVVFSSAQDQPKRYVQDALAEQSALVADHLVNQHGHVFVCGSLAMGRAVKQAIVSALLVHADISRITTESAAKARVTQWLESGQIVTELW
ncbi:hypothetical protein Gpo141_00004765 [Globisporangium polare]